MSLPKGRTNNPNGRPAGSGNKATKGLRERISAFLSDNWETMGDAFSKLEAKDKIYFYSKLLNFALPTLQSVPQSAIIEAKLQNMTSEQLDKLIDAIEDIANEQTGEDKQD